MHCNNVSMDTRRDVAGFVAGRVGLAALAVFELRCGTPNEINRNSERQPQGLTLADKTPCFLLSPGLPLGVWAKPQ